MKKFNELFILLNQSGIGPSFINENLSSIEKLSDEKDTLNFIYEKKGIKTSDDVFSQLKNKLDQTLAYAQKQNVKIITLFDDEYPQQLKDLSSKTPSLLYAKGNIDLLKKNGVAIVGTRNPCEQAMKFEKALLEKSPELMENVIVSGLAFGCDKIAHETTVKLKKQTIAVLPCGVDIITPPSHKNLAQQILDTDGCLLSIFELGRKVQNFMYVDRDATIAALSKATFVVECGVKSGTMHTVEAAKKMNRPIGCYIPTMKNCGDFSGNELIIKGKGGIQISSQEGLKKFLDLIKSSKQSKVEKVQLSLL